MYCKRNSILFFQFQTKIGKAVFACSETPVQCLITPESNTCVTDSENCDDKGFSPEDASKPLNDNQTRFNDLIRYL